MCICETGERLVLLCELSQIVHDVDELSADYLQSVAHDDNVCVVAYIARCSTEVDDACGVWTSLTVCENMSHNIVASYLFALGSHFVVHIIDVLLQLLYLSLGNRETKLHFGSCQSHPQLSPCGELLIGREDILHLLAGITCTERAFIAFDITAHLKCSPLKFICVFRIKYQFNYIIISFSCQ